MEGKPQIVLFAIHAILFLASSSTADNHGQDPYPNTNCFKDLPLLKWKLAEEIESFGECSSFYPDKDSLCFKICMLRTNDIILTTEIPQLNDSSESEETQLRNYEKILEYNFTTDPTTIMTGMLMHYCDGLNVSDLQELEKDPKINEIDTAMENGFTKCEITSIVIPKEEHACKLFTPETKEKMEKLKNCIEKILNCEA